MMELLGNYPPIFVEQFLSYFDKNTALPRRSYDFIVDLTRPTDIFDVLKAYPIRFPLGKDVYDKKLGENKDRFVVNVVGRYNVGKSYILRLLANIDLGDSFTERTIGVSVSLPSPKDTNGIPMALVDTAGTRTPVLFDNENFDNISYQRQVSDSFIQEVALNSADIFVLVVNQLTLDDQLYLKTLTRRLKEKGFDDEKIKQRLLIVHNYFNLNTAEQIQSVEQTELKKMFSAKQNEKDYWVSKNYKHFVFANNNSPFGKAFNKKSIENIRTMISGAHGATNPDVLQKIIQETQNLLRTVLIEEELNNTTANSDKTQKNKGWFSYVVAAAFWRSDSKEFHVENKRQVQIELELKNVTFEPKITLWFICPKANLSKNIVLSKNLRFHEDGSVYVDFSSQFVPQFDIIRRNKEGDVVIRLECPLCSNVTVRRKGMTSILIVGEKSRGEIENEYFNTRRIGKFEVEVSLDKLNNSHNVNNNLILDLKSMQKSNLDGVIQITIPIDTSVDDQQVFKDEL
ncbi:unnamed protein product [Adineta steineri]|uniref:Guanylate-binding protein N-terminal domain-containing protein n=1 Tax=Adineta steineri TaxID=433720 RepID=A0A818XMC9_9BILA|nr:unnamed protein product [Adineta steineri]CAF3738795.1 unnamed protein product [Adineta steineri]